MKRPILFSTIVLLIVVSIKITKSEIPPKDKLRLSLRKPDIVDLVFISANNWRYVMRNNGSYMFDSPDADGNGIVSGGEFPRGSGTSIIFAGGMYFGTLKDGIPVVSECEFYSEFQPGRIINSGMSFPELRAQSPLLPSNKVYTIYRNTGSSDYQNWPPDAPRNQFGQPALIADVQTWAVFNDLDTTRNQEASSKSPNPGLGIEIVLESFAFKGPRIGDVVFFKFTSTNKTNVDYKDCFFGIWSDPDVDNANNDIIGTDTLRNMVFCYNDDNGDDPLVAGFDIIQGPIVYESQVPTKFKEKFGTQKTKLTFNAQTGKYLASSLDIDQFIMGAVSTAYYVGGGDPVDNEERYYTMAGRWWSGEQKSGCGYRDYYAHRGNPITGQGTCDVAGHNNPDPNAQHADQRMLISSGPFTIKSGESQEIWVAVIGAKGSANGPSSEPRLNAVWELWKTSDIAQQVFDSGLKVSSPPSIPELSATALDRRVVLSWKNNAESSFDDFGDALNITTANGYTAGYIGYDFQGYRVYRSLTGLPESFKLLAQYDMADSLGVVTYNELSENNNLITKEVNLGSNTGLQYKFTDSTVVPGRTYFYSVTAYDAQPYIAGPDSITVDGLTIKRPSGIPISLESSIEANAIRVTAHRKPAESLRQIRVVPNPFYISADFNGLGSIDRNIRFINLPPSCSIKIFTVSGDLVKIIYHNASSNNLRNNTNPYDPDYDPEPAYTSVETWDLRNANGHKIAGGMYIALIEAGGGKTLEKFAVIR